MDRRARLLPRRRPPPSLVRSVSSPSLLLLLLLLLPPPPPLLAVAEPACKMDVSEPAPDGARLVGENLLAGRPEVSYTPSQYSRAPGGGYVLCTCEIKTCVYKCCSPGKAFDGTRCSEVDDGDDDDGGGGGGGDDGLAARSVLAHTLEVPKFVNESGIIETFEMNEIHVIYNGGLKCKDYFELDPMNEPDHNFGISVQGDLQNVSGSYIASPEEFCLEQQKEINEEDFQITAIVCAQFDTPNTPVTGVHFHIPRNTKAMLISLPFLLLTFFVYAIITELHCNLHGKSLMCLVASLFFAYITCITNQIVTIVIPDAYNFCINLAYIQQFFFVATFFWLNVMCFDLWKNIRIFNQSLTECKVKKFINYSKYAWGCSFLISIVTFFMDKYSSMQHGLQIILPEFEYYNTCWFHSQKDKMLYFHGPIGITLLSNLLMFMYSAIMIIFKYLRYVKVPSVPENKLNDNMKKQRFMLCSKLFIIMSVFWLTEIISWTISDPIVAWAIIHSWYASQGVWIFIICVYNSPVLLLLNKKLCPCFHSNNR